MRRLPFCRVCVLLGCVPFLAPPWARAYELKRTEAGRAVRWSGVREVVLRIDPALYRRFGRARLHEALAIAASAWREVEGVPRIRFSRSAPPPIPAVDGTPAVYLDRDWLAEDGALAVTALAFDASSGRILDADVVLSGSRRLALLDETDGEDGAEGEAVYDLASVLAHELGHALGLDESRDDPEATMWPTQAPWDVGRRDLSEDDRAGLRALYGTEELAADGAGAIAPSRLASEEPPPGGCGGASLAEPPRGEGGWFALWVPLLLGLARRRWSGSAR